MLDENIKIVSFDNEKLMLVNENDDILGYENKNVCHVGQGKLHRAFSIFIFNSKNQLLIQKRSSLKLLWPLYWSNSCCSHPRKGETNAIATQRRLQEELGFTTALNFLFKFKYHACFENKGSEHELCSVYVGISDDTVIVNPHEIDRWQYIDINKLTQHINRYPENYTPWFKLEWQRVSLEYSNLAG